MNTAKSKYLGSIEINGRHVGFFSPPHDEPDFLWVEVFELARCFVDKKGANIILQHAINFDRKSRVAETAAKGNMIVTIIPHILAKSICEIIDRESGYQKKGDEWAGGPRETKYVVAFGDAMFRYFDLPIEQLVAAFENQGGPNLRGFPKGGVK